MLKNYGRILYMYRSYPSTSIRSYVIRETISGCLNPRPTLRPSKISRYAKVPEGYYGGRHMITMLPGSGIGPEMMKHAIKIFDVVKAPIDFEIIPIRPDHYKKDLKYAIISIRRNGACIKAGNIEERNTPSDIPSANVEIRRQLDMFVSIAQCISYPRVKCKHQGVNMVVIRQNTEGEYAMLEHENKKGVVESLKIVTKHNCLRIAEWMFKYCVDQNRKKITIVHKSSILKFTDGLFLNTVMDVARKYPFLEIENSYVDRFCLEVVQNPQQYDVVITSNLYGSVITNTVCGLIGGAGITSGRNYGENCALFETATRNSAETLANQNVANPVAMLHAVADLLWHLDHEIPAFMIRRAILRCFNENITTNDLGGTHKASEVVDRIIDFIKDEHNYTCPISRAP